MTDPLCDVLAETDLAGHLSQAQFDKLWQEARASRVDTLLAEVLWRRRDGMPVGARQPIVDRLRVAHATEMMRRWELCRIITAFAASDIDLLLLKGAAFAYTIYPQPHLRPADDIDLFIRRDSLNRAERSLAACGYDRAREPDAELASSQRHYVRQDVGAMFPWIDLHWRVANPRLFAHTISFEEAWVASAPVPMLGSAARTLGAADALLLACVHRVAHHNDRPDLLWIWDIHLLAGLLSATDVDVFVRRAERSGMRAVAARGLELALDRCGTPAAPGLIRRLTAGSAREPAMRFLGGGLRPVDVLRSDLAATKSLGQRLQLLREHLLPARSYMRTSYRGWPAALLPLAYLDRIVRGAPKWFRRPTEATSRSSPSRGKESGP